MDEKEGNDLFNEPQGDNAPADPAPPAEPNGPQAEGMTPQADAPQAETPQPEGPEKRRSEADKEKRKKRILAVALAAILVVIVVLIILLLLRSCQPGHVYSGVWGSDDNQHWQICDDCGEPSEKEDHHFGDWTIIKQPTCTEEGEREHTCVECGKTVSETIPPEEHDWGDWVILLDPTCTEEGRVRHECNTCGEVEEETVAPTGHYCDEDDWQRDEDEHWHICTVCGEEFDRGEHDWGSGVTQEGGDEAEFTCSECGGTKIEEVDPDEHTWGEWTVTKQPTCTETGAREHTCSDCGLTLEEILPANGHSYGAWSTTKQPTCGEEGARERTCAVCGYTQTGRLPATGEHTYNAWVVFKEATCTEEGERRRTCTECGQTWAAPIEKLGHDPSPDWKSDEEDHWHECELCGTRLDEAAHTWDGGKTTVVPTPDNTGLKVYTCTECGATREEVLPVTEHLWGDWTVTKQPTCTQTGLREHTCLDCGKTEEEVIPANGHTYTGWRSDADEHWHICSVCGVTFGREEHTWNNGTVTKQPACEETGTRTYTCTKCEATKTETVEALGHSWGAWTTTKEATCTETGVREHTCTVCGTKKTESIPTIEHSWDNGTVTKQPTCTQTGVRTYTCEVCGATKTESVAATGKHVLGDWESDGTTHWKVCEQCGDRFETANHSDAENAWIYDKEHPENGHYQVCDVCGAHFNQETEHTAAGDYINANDGTHYRLCEKCGAPCDKTNHAYNGKGNDETGHWDECVCGAIENKEAHTWEYIPYPDDPSEGHIKECTECGYSDETVEAHEPKGETQGNQFYHYDTCGKCGQELDPEPHSGVHNPGDTCHDCGVTVNYSAGLKFVLRGNGTDASPYYFAVAGIGTVTDGNIVIPAEYANAESKYVKHAVAAIGGNAFNTVTTPGDLQQDITITSIYIPASVKGSEGGAFQYCGSLTNIYYGGSLANWCAIEFIGDGYASPTQTCDVVLLYTGCTAGAKGAVTKGTPIEGDITLQTSVGNFAFYGYDRLTSVTMTGGERVGNSSFAYNTKLAAFDFGSSVETIGNNAFQNCTALPRITITESIDTIGSYAFTGCNALTKANFEKPAGWFWNNTPILEAELSNEEDAADYLTGRDAQYTSYTWIRK